MKLEINLKVNEILGFKCCTSKHEDAQLLYLELWVERFVGQHAPDICDGGGHTLPHDVVRLIFQVLCQVQGITIIYNIRPEQEAEIKISELYVSNVHTVLWA